MWFIYDSCGIGCCVATYCIMSFVSILVTKVSIIPLSEESYLSSSIFIGIYILFLGLGGLSHFICMVTDPGAIPRNSVQITIEDGKVPSNYCVKCRCMKYDRTHHCSVCERCISKMDHHCPWVNNCVGAYNQKHFVLFLFYIQVSCLYSFILLIIRASFCPNHKKAPLCLRQKQEVAADLLLGMAAFFVGAIFFLFVSVMLYDQLVCISNNTSGIEVLKKSTIEKRPVKENFEETFGGKLGIFWLLPTKVPKKLSRVMDFNELT